MKASLYKEYIFSILLFVFVFSYIDLSAIRMLSLRGMNIYYGDLFFSLALLVASLVIIKRRSHWQLPAATWYLVFLAWLTVAVIWGLPIYGYRAFGEFRYVLPFFAFFVPYFLLRDKQNENPALSGRYIRLTTFIAAGASLLFLACSLINRKPFYFSELHVNNQKIWAHKIISSDQTFYISALAMFLFFMSLNRNKFISLLKIVFFFLLFIALPTYNRTAMISLFLVFPVLLAWGKKTREIAFASASLVVLLILLHVVPAIERLYYPAQGPREALDSSLQPLPDFNAEQIKGMGTGFWRFYQSKAAFREALKKPFFGHHLGGYFDFFIPEMKAKNTVPPHNQFVLIFLKTGAVGLILLLAPLVLLLRRLFVYFNDSRLETNERPTVWLLLLVLIAQFPYGLGFGFIALYAIYFGFAVIFLDALAMKYPPQVRTQKA